MTILKLYKHQIKTENKIRCVSISQVMQTIRQHEHSLVRLTETSDLFSIHKISYSRYWNNESMQGRRNVFGSGGDITNFVEGGPCFVSQGALAYSPFLELEGPFLKLDGPFLSWRDPFLSWKAPFWTGGDPFEQEWTLSGTGGGPFFELEGPFFTGVPSRTGGILFELKGPFQKVGGIKSG